MTSRRLAAVQAPVIPIVGEWIRNSPGTLSLGQGMVFYPPPESALIAVRDFGSKPEHHLYGATLGYPPLIELIRQKLDAENGITLDAGNDVMITAGSNMAFLNVLLAITDPGDEIILPLPYYFNQEMAIRMANCTPVDVPTDANYQLDLNRIKAAITEKTRAIVTISPNNPSGAVYSQGALTAINNLCRENRIFHISDEAYEYFIYDGNRHFSPASLPGAAPHTISLFSLSKAYGFASWRVGYFVAPKGLIPDLVKVHDTNLICPPLLNQFAAAGALQSGSAYCREHLPVLNRNRKTVLDRLQALNDICAPPVAQGAFYALLKINCQLDDRILVKNLIETDKVAAIPGSAFGLTVGCYLRLSYGMLNPDQLNDALTRLITGLRRLT